MNKNEIADLLITSNSAGAIPIFLDIDEEKIELDLKKSNGVIFYGNHAVFNMNKMASQLQNLNLNIQTIKSDIELNNIYIQLMNHYQQTTAFIPPQIIIIEDIDKLYNTSKMQKELLEILRKGHGVQLYFLCCATKSNLPSNLSINFPIRVEEFYSSNQNGFNAVFDYIGKRQTIKLN